MQFSEAYHEYSVTVSTSGPGELGTVIAIGPLNAHSLFSSSKPLLFYLSLPGMPFPHLHTYQAYIVFKSQLIYIFPCSFPWFAYIKNHFLLCNPTTIWGGYFIVLKITVKASKNRA